MPTASRQATVRTYPYWCNAVVSGWLIGRPLAKGTPLTVCVFLHTSKLARRSSISGNARRFTQPPVTSCAVCHPCLLLHTRRSSCDCGQWFAREDRYGASGLHMPLTLKQGIASIAKRLWPYAHVRCLATDTLANTATYRPTLPRHIHRAWWLLD